MVLKNLEKDNPHGDTVMGIVHFGIKREREREREIEREREREDEDSFRHGCERNRRPRK